jgi:hypothetical protein
LFFFLRFFFKLIFFNFILEHLIYWELIFVLFFCFPFYVFAGFTRVDTSLSSHCFILFSWFRPWISDCFIMKFHDFIQLAFDEVTLISRSGHRFDMLTQVNLGFFLFFFVVNFLINSFIVMVFFLFILFKLNLLNSVELII